MKVCPSEFVFCFSGVYIYICIVYVGFKAILYKQTLGTFFFPGTSSGLVHAGHSLDPTKLLTSLRKEFISGRNLPLFLTKERHEETKPPCKAVCFSSPEKKFATHFLSDDLIPEVVIHYFRKKKKNKNALRTCLVSPRIDVFKGCPWKLSLQETLFWGLTSHIKLVLLVHVNFVYLLFVCRRDKM